MSLRELVFTFFPTDSSFFLRCFSFILFKKKKDSEEKEKEMSVGERKKTRQAIFL